MPDLTTSRASPGPAGAPPATRDLDEERTAMARTDEGLPPEREAFRRHYEESTSDWANHSGGGSHPYFTIEYRTFLDKFIRMNDVKTVLDVGCGDWQFSKYINFDGVEYLGVDVVPSVVAHNEKRYSSNNVRFAVMPARLAQLPSGDLLIMKDVLQHLPNDEILRFAAELFPRFKFCLLTNSFVKLNTRRNTDVAHGGFRCLDLSAPPFSFDGCYVLEFASSMWERLRTFSIHRRA